MRPVNSATYRDGLCDRTGAGGRHHPERDERLGGFSIIAVPTREEANAWVARIAVACRCAQEVREPMFDPES